MELVSFIQNCWEMEGEKKVPSISFAWFSYKRAVEMIEKKVKTVISGGNSMLDVDFCFSIDT